MDAYEIESRLADRATVNLSDRPNVKVRNCSGSDTELCACDVIYVNAGATGPRNRWLDALRPGGRLLFPLTPAEGAGAMLLLVRGSEDRFEARFVCRAMFIPCAGARDETVAKDLSGAFQCKDLKAVRSLRRHSEPDDTCWFAGPDWWLSTAGV